MNIGVKFGVAGSFFGVSYATVSHYFTTWIFALTQFCRIQFPFPSQEQNKRTFPDAFRECFGDSRVRLTLDTTNLNLASASDPDVQKQTFNEYYGCTYLYL